MQQEDAFLGGYAGERITRGLLDEGNDVGVSFENFFQEPLKARAFRIGIIIDLDYARNEILAPVMSQLRRSQIYRPIRDVQQPATLIELSGCTSAHRPGFGDHRLDARPIFRAPRMISKCFTLITIQNVGSFFVHGANRLMCERPHGLFVIAGPAPPVENQPRSPILAPANILTMAPDEPLCVSKVGEWNFRQRRCFSAATARAEPFQCTTDCGFREEFG